MRLSRTVRAGLFAAVLAAGAHQLLSAAEYTGQVTFAGAPVPGATVVAIQAERHVTTTTNREGVYRLPDLDEGVWTIQVEMRGFAPLTREVTITSDAMARDTWELAILSLAEIARAGTAVAELPRATGPAPTQPGQPATEPIATRAPPPPPGAVQTPPPQPGAAGAPAAAAAPAPAFEGAGIAVAGTREEERPSNPLFGAADAFLVNGSVLNAAASPYSQSQAFGTFRLQQGSRWPYRIETRIGGRTAALDARPVGLASRPSNHNLNVESSISGPLRIPGLVRNGPTFMLTFSRRDNYNARSSSLLLPTARERMGDFSQSRDAFGRPIPIVDPLTGAPFPGNIIPPERLSHEALALVAHYPRATDGGDGRANYHGASISAGRTDSVTFRLPAAIGIGRRSTIDTLGFGYSRTAADNTTPFAFEDLARTSGVNGSARFSYRLSPFLVARVSNTVTYGSSRTEPHFAHRLNVSALAGITGNNQDPAHWGPPSLRFRTVEPLSVADYASSRRLTNLTVAQFDWSRRRHLLTFGGEARRRHADILSQQNPRGTFSFTGAATGNDVADFLLGLPSASTIAFGNADKYFRQSSYAAYVTDDFRVSPSLTMTLGVRWEYEAPVTETRDRLVSLDVAPDFTGASPVLASDSVGALTGRRYTTSLVGPDRRGLQPRVAMAWRPFLGSSVIVRAGYGIYRSTNVYESIAMRLAQQPPLSFAVSAERSDETPITLANGFVASPGITQNSWAIDPDFRVGYAHNWQAIIQRDFPWALHVAATYLGVKGSRLPQILLPNTYAPGADNPCADCPVGFQYLTSGGSSYVHRGHLQVRRRMRGGFEASGEYTLSTGADNASSFVGIGGTPAQNWRDLDAERGPSAEVRRHEFETRVQYQSSIGAGRRGWRGPLLGGWMLSSRFAMGSGLPLTPVYHTTVPGTAGLGTMRPSLTGEPLRAVEEGYYLNPAAFAPPAPGEWGDAPRGAVRGPGLFSLNGTLSRPFQVSPRTRLTYQLQVSNILNRVTHAGVNMSVGSPQFGLPIGFTPPRQLNMSLGMTF